MRIRATALRTAILPVFHLRTLSEGVPQVRIFPTPPEGETKKRGNYSPSEGGTKMRGNDSPSGGGNGVGCWKMQLQAALGEVVPLRTFGR